MVSAGAPPSRSGAIADHTVRRHRLVSAAKVDLGTSLTGE
jgi:hypothetical protein